MPMGRSGVTRAGAPPPVRPALASAGAVSGNGVRSLDIRGKKPTPLTHSLPWRLRRTTVGKRRGLVKRIIERKPISKLLCTHQPPTLDARPVDGRLDLPLPAFVAEGYFSGVGPWGEVDQRTHSLTPSRGRGCKAQFVMAGPSVRAESSRAPDSSRGTCGQGCLRRPRSQSSRTTPCGGQIPPRRRPRSHRE